MIKTYSINVRFSEHPPPRSVIFCVFRKFIGFSVAICCDVVQIQRKRNEPDRNAVWSRGRKCLPQSHLHSVWTDETDHENTDGNANKKNRTTVRTLVFSFFVLVFLCLLHVCSTCSDSILFKNVCAFFVSVFGIKEGNGSVVLRPRSFLAVSPPRPRPPFGKKTKTGEMVPGPFSTRAFLCLSSASAFLQFRLLRLSSFSFKPPNISTGPDAPPPVWKPLPPSVIIPLCVFSQFQNSLCLSLSLFSLCWDRVLRGGRRRSAPPCG